MLQAFDAPNGDFACVRRTRSNTPLQALTTLNEPIYLECARALALRTLRRRREHRFRSPGLRVPPLPVARAHRAGELDAARPAAPADRDGSRDPRPIPWALAANDPAKPPQLPAGATPAAARGLDGRRRGSC